MQSEDECVSLRQRSEELESELREALNTRQSNLDVNQETSNNDELAALQKMIDQQAEEIRQLSDQLAGQQQLEHQINELSIERSSLQEQLEAAKPSESNEKLEKAVVKMKKMLKATKDKINQIVFENPELFDGVSEDTNERLDHLISTLQNQAARIAHLQPDRDNDWSQR